MSLSEYKNKTVRKNGETDTARYDCTRMWEVMNSVLKNRIGFRNKFIIFYIFLHLQVINV